MNYTYLFSGLASLAFGLILTGYQINTFVKGKQDELGWDIKGLSAGVIFIMMGIYLLTHL